MDAVVLDEWDLSEPAHDRTAIGECSMHDVEAAAAGEMRKAEAESCGISAPIVAYSADLLLTALTTVHCPMW